MFECEYCETQFISTDAMDTHECKNRDRMMELTTLNGITAFKYYTLWFKKRGLREQPKDSFIVSRYYNTFFKFKTFVNDMSIPDISLYIELMIAEKIVPQHWYNSDIYDFFIDYLDNDCSPEIHTRITLLTLDKLATIFECSISDIFSHLHPTDVANLIQSRNLSPWIMLLSTKFKAFLVNDTTSGERSLIENVIKIDRWKIIMESKRNFIPEIKTYLNQLDL